MRDLIFLVLLAFGLWLVSVWFDLHDTLHTLMDETEGWEIDEAILALAFAGVAGFIYATRRNYDLRQEANRRRLAENQAQWIAQHDTLTNLPNRQFLNNWSQDILRSNHLVSHHAILVIALTGLNRINELPGKTGQNEALILEMVRRLTEAFSQDIVARLHEDTFAVVMEIEDERQVLRKANQAIASLTRPTTSSEPLAEISTNVGIALRPDHAATLDGALRCADVALLAARRKGRNTLALFSPGMDMEQARRADSEKRLRQAITQRLIIPHYQPVINLTTGQLHGFETLARWSPDPYETITPSVFIDMAEDIGAITDLTEQLLTQACKDALDWPSHLQLSVNISASMLTDRLLALRIIRILGETGFPPQRLELEITEHAYIRHLETAEDLLGDLHAAGISIALDDFGTGYSSLSHLAHLMFDKIKIDQSFVQGAEDDEKQHKILTAMLSLANVLGLETTAEGIETENQLKNLQQAGCLYGQGYLFGPAVAAQDVTQFMALPVNAEVTDQGTP